jgi:two-component system phosphate regulon sensor histidine kinase PhoR
MNETELSLKETAEIIKSDISSIVNLDTALMISRFKNYEKVLKIRVTLIDKNGKVIADSRANSEIMDLHSNRLEFQEALNGTTGFAIRKSYTMGTEYMYIAIPIFSINNEVMAVIRTAASIEELNDEFRIIYFKIILISIILYAVGSLTGYIISKKIVKPLDKIQEGARHLASGNLMQKIASSNIEEYSNLTDSLNEMSKQLNDKIKIISEQKNIQESVLKSMKEGVIAFDNEMNILFINNEARKLLGIEQNNIIGKPIQESIRIFDFQKFLSKILINGKSIESELIIQDEKDIFLQLTGNLLINPDSKPIGVIIVINDISEIKYLDTLKKDFIANVSHELKTPITTIKGFSETILQEGINDKENINRFINIIYKNADRLNLIIDDLLRLSKLEKASEIENTEFQNEKILPLIQLSVESFSHKAISKNIQINIECNKEIEALVNANLIEQALSNLIDNSIKYSPDNTVITVKSSIVDNNLQISVKDRGYGIPQEHIPRLFERFYRIDKGRSREYGGTGLGLAIVKHIAKLHNGTVEVTTEVNSGSEFCIKIPINK